MITSIDAVKGVYTFDIYLQITVKKKRSKKQRRKGKIQEFQRIARRDKKAFLSDQCKEIEENNRMGKISLRKLEIPREHFMQRWAR